MTTYAFTTGQTVRHSTRLRRDWHDGRAAVVDRPGLLPIGRITDRHPDGYCGSCDADGTECAGPWYSVDFGEGPSNGLGGIYAEHELEVA